MQDNKRLFRSDSRMVGGVCGGIAEYFGCDPTIVRLAFALLTVFFAVLPGIIFYVLCCIIIPRKDL